MTERPTDWLNYQFENNNNALLTELQPTIMLLRCLSRLTQHGVWSKEDGRDRLIVSLAAVLYSERLCKRLFSPLSPLTPRSHDSPLPLFWIKEVFSGRCWRVERFNFNWVMYCKTGWTTDHHCLTVDRRFWEWNGGSHQFILIARHQDSAGPKICIL